MQRLRHHPTKEGPYAQGCLPQIRPGFFFEILPVPLHEIQDQRAHEGLSQQAAPPSSSAAAAIASRWSRRSVLTASRAFHRSALAMVVAAETAKTPGEGKGGGPEDELFTGLIHVAAQGAERQRNDKTYRSPLALVRHLPRLAGATTPCRTPKARQECMPRSFA